MQCCVHMNNMCASKCPDWAKNHCTGCTRRFWLLRQHSGADTARERGSRMCSSLPDHTGLSVQVAASYANKGLAMLVGAAAGLRKQHNELAPPRNGEEQALPRKSEEQPQAGQAGLPLSERSFSDDIEPGHERTLSGQQVPAAEVADPPRCNSMRKPLLHCTVEALDEQIVQLRLRLA